MRERERERFEYDQADRLSSAFLEACVVLFAFGYKGEKILSFHSLMISYQILI